MTGYLKFTQETIKNHWFELNAYQEKLEDSIKEYLMNGFYLKFGENVDELYEAIVSTADSLLQMFRDLSDLYNVFEDESLGFSLDIAVTYTGDEYAGYIVDNIEVIVS